MSCGGDVDVVVLSVCGHTRVVGPTWALESESGSPAWFRSQAAPQPVSSHQIRLFVVVRAHAVLVHYMSGHIHDCDSDNANWPADNTYPSQTSQRLTCYCTMIDYYYYITRHAESSAPMPHVAIRECLMACNSKVFCDTILVRAPLQVETTKN